MNTPKFMNSYLSNNGNSPAKPIINNVGNALSSITNTASNIGQTVMNTGANITSNVSNAVTNATGVSSGSGIVLILAGIAFLAMLWMIYIYYDKIKAWIPDSVKFIFGGGDMSDGPKVTGPLAEAPPSAPVTTAPPTNVEKPLEPTPASSVEAILPGRKEVFNVSSNRYTYSDAEPLCRALGAQLATYDQVKDAFDKGGDWCNYGWTKGQLALFPTQKETYEKLQLGPEGQRMACGKPGLNGGHFDNPDLRFGVNCYGIKPSQSQHDASKESMGAPISPSALEFDKKVSQYKSESDNIGIMPFREGAWSS
jgi:hypothetical protein